MFFIKQIGDFFTWVSERSSLLFMIAIFFLILSCFLDFMASMEMRNKIDSDTIEEALNIRFVSLAFKKFSLVVLVMEYIGRMLEVGSWLNFEFTRFDGFLVIFLILTSIASFKSFAKIDNERRQTQDEMQGESTAISSVDAELAYLLRKHEQVSSELTPRKYRSFAGYRRESSGYSSDITKYLKKRQTSRTVSSANSKKRTKARVWTPEMQAEINRKLELR